jgi:hypothetical protein
VRVNAAAARAIEQRAPARRVRVRQRFGVMIQDTLRLDLEHGEPVHAAVAAPRGAPEPIPVSLDDAGDHHIDRGVQLADVVRVAHVSP